MPDSKSRNPFSGVTDLFSEFGRMRELGTHGRESGQGGGQRTHASAWVPATDIVARGADLVILVELAGVEPDDVHLAFDHGLLTVSGSRTPDPADLDDSAYYVRERFYGEFRRSFTLPDGTEPSHISAEFDDGLVEIVVRDGAERDPSTRIQVTNRSGAPTSRTLS